MHRSVRATTAALFLTASGLLSAQDAPSGFDVVSIKRNTAARGRTVPQTSPGRLLIEALTLRDLIGASFRSPGTRSSSRVRAGSTPICLRSRPERTMLLRST